MLRISCRSNRTCVSGVEWREVLLASVDPRTFEPPLIVVERDVVIHFGSREDALDPEVGKSRRTRRWLASRGPYGLPDEVLDADVLGGHLLEEAVLNGVAKGGRPTRLPSANAASMLACRCRRASA